MWTQISLIRNPVRRVSSKPDGRPLPSRAHASGPAPRRSRHAASPAPGGLSGLAAAPARASYSRSRLSPGCRPMAPSPRSPGGGCPRRGRTGREASPSSRSSEAFAPPPASDPSGPRATSLLRRNYPGNLVTPRYTGYTELNVRNEVSKAACEPRSFLIRGSIPIQICVLKEERSSETFPLADFPTDALVGQLSEAAVTAA